SFRFDDPAGFSLVGGVTESPKAISAFDPNFKMQIAWNNNQEKFSQKVELSQPKVKVTGVLEFMTCNDTNCLPPEEVPFSIDIDASKAFAEAKASQPATAEPAPAAANSAVQPEEPATASLPADSNLSPEGGSDTVATPSASGVTTPAAPEATAPASDADSSERTLW